MKKRVVLVSAAAAVLGLAAAILGFVAEGTKSNAFVGIDELRCVYRRTPALGCGVVAALFALAGLSIVTAASGCFGRFGGDAPAPGPRRSTAVKLSAVAWVLVAVAVVMFLFGASRNVGGTRDLPVSGSGRRYSRTYYYGCTVLKNGVFSTASIASALATGCAIAAYVYLQPSHETAPGQGQFVGSPGVAMGQPQWSQPYPPAYPPPVAYPPPSPYGGYGAKQPAVTA
ncbi:uncharacterized protein LOC133920480 [Phragmites australis]|uniref:uncharacterized protein LOC133920480 n=1 Tax=Phragmites australis TaxID=29695 RepID=UPI002D783DAB|nr:uncharacterized protein LOC133920480 [Phragmites australis]